MVDKKSVTIAFAKGCRPFALHTPEAEALMLRMGELRTKRVSYVWRGSELRIESQNVLRAEGRLTEETEASFFADLHPVEGPIFGPFPTREMAIEVEVAYIDENLMTIAKQHKVNHNDYCN